MALKWKISSLDEVDEHIRDQYQPAKNGSGFVLDVDDSEEERTKNLKSAFETQKGELQKLKTQLSKFDGVDLDKYQNLLDVQTKLENEKLKKEGDFEKLQQKLEKDFQSKLEASTSKHQQELEHFKGLADGYKGQLMKEMVSTGLTGALAKHKGDPRFLLHHLESRVKVSEEEVEGKPSGKLSVTVLNKDGEAWNVVDDQTKSLRPATYDDLVNEYKNDEEWGGAFYATGAGGTGSSQGSSRSAPRGRQLSLDQVADMSLEQIEATQESIKKGEASISG